MWPKAWSGSGELVRVVEVGAARPTAPLRLHPRVTVVRGVNAGSLGVVAHGDGWALPAVAATGDATHTEEAPAWPVAMVDTAALLAHARVEVDDPRALERAAELRQEHKYLTTRMELVQDRLSSVEAELARLQDDGRAVDDGARREIERLVVEAERIPRSEWAIDPRAAALREEWDAHLRACAEAGFGTLPDEPDAQLAVDLARERYETAQGGDAWEEQAAREALEQAIERRALAERAAVRHAPLARQRADLQAQTLAILGFQPDDPMLRLGEVRVPPEAARGALDRLEALRNVFASETEIDVLGAARSWLDARAVEQRLLRRPDGREPERQRCVARRESCEDEIAYLAASIALVQAAQAELAAVLGQDLASSPVAEWLAGPVTDALRNRLAVAGAPALVVVDLALAEMPPATAEAVLDLLGRGSDRQVLVLSTAAVAQEWAERHPEVAVVIDETVPAPATRVDAARPAAMPLPTVAAEVLDAEMLAAEVMAAERSGPPAWDTVPAGPSPHAAPALAVVAAVAADAAAAHPLAADAPEAEWASHVAWSPRRTPDEVRATTQRIVALVNGRVRTDGPRGAAPRMAPGASAWAPVSPGPASGAGDTSPAPIPSWPSGVSSAVSSGAPARAVEEPRATLAPWTPEPAWAPEPTPAPSWPSGVSSGAPARAVEEPRATLAPWTPEPAWVPEPSPAQADGAAAMLAPVPDWAALPEAASNRRLDDPGMRQGDPFLPDPAALGLPGFDPSRAWDEGQWSPPVDDLAPAAAPAPRESVPPRAGGDAWWAPVPTPFGPTPAGMEHPSPVDAYPVDAYPVDADPVDVDSAAGGLVHPMAAPAPPAVAIAPEPQATPFGPRPNDELIPPWHPVAPVAPVAPMDTVMAEPVAAAEVDDALEAPTGSGRRRFGWGRGGRRAARERTPEPQLSALEVFEDRPWERRWAQEPVTSPVAGVSTVCAKHQVAADAQCRRCREMFCDDCLVPVGAQHMCVPCAMVVAGIPPRRS